ncbi:DNA gyrase subunit A [Clostridium homopropionicum DSM 5847]|uniref:DNA topoisomerase (ATP-hydrolyzing) n=1 Tax=Clostridium homopropionicum DSM 5847 TaxID=1121318 RepID=A0A0L6ZCB7_9CLOT|nr:DNA topoisomerase IV subunit A [Clostridium homopropionicum]KOA20443.1 DNA gyrase subunit A [Clostridium homopropionicum DSM 5847]SFG35086.1 topoisomerase-4 subunit A [Clostridium homopropionicum]
MSKKNIDIPFDKNIVPVSIAEVMPDNYLPYAVEVAKERALPDVRDGLKPVHRRILYGAYKLKAMPDKPYFKSARIVGDILGKYHPHGDTSVYESMVILAQNFTTRKTLIDGHGNWGSIDGDNAAAMRYTEARLTYIALEMLRDIDKDVVEMVNNYSDTELEPKVLPARFPNLLVNGAFGIAVGLATNIPPHNLGEVIDAAIGFIENKDITVKELMNYIKGPDLPTGGIIIGEQAILSAYENGEGRVTLRAKTSIEKLDNDRYGIIITEFPYRRNKAKTLQAISEMTADKKHSKALECITDIRDESDRNGIRAVIEFKKSTDKDTMDRVLKYLFKRTDLQVNINFNMVAIADGKPRTLNLLEIINYYVKHQKDVTTRKTKKELEIARKRFHIVEGFIKAIDIMDDILKTIRASKSKKDSEENLINKFQFTQAQAEAIVELMLYKLTGLEIKVFQKEYAELERQIKMLNKILESEKELLKVIKKDLTEVKEKYNDCRKTEIIANDEMAKIENEELILEEDIIITMSNEGYIKRISEKAYKRINGDINEIEYREGDFNKYFLSGNTKDNLFIFTNKGNMYQIRCSQIPEMKWKEKGERIDTLVKSLSLEDEKIISTIIIEELKEDGILTFFTNKGMIKKTSLLKYETNYTKIVALKLKNDEELIKVTLENTNNVNNNIKVVTRNGLEVYLRLPEVEITDRNIWGMQILNICSEDKIIQIDYIEELETKTFIANIDNKGNVKISSLKILKNTFGCTTDSLSKILIFTDTGKAILLLANMIENLDKEGICLDKVVDGFDKEKDRVINVISIKGFDEDYSLYFFSSFGYVKKTALNEFLADFTCTKAYKFKSENDKLINVQLINNSVQKDILLITQFAMSIRFEDKAVSFMGKIASGVTGISLKEGDKVIFAQLISKVKDDEVAFHGEDTNELCIRTKNNYSLNIPITEIKLQNRAGRGKKIGLLDIDDYIIEIK